jgi:hypothetical protein
MFHRQWVANDEEVYIMDKSILLVTVLSLALSSVPAIAENPAPFHAISQLSTGLTETAEGFAVNPMTDEQLADVEGGILWGPVVVFVVVDVLAASHTGSRGITQSCGWEA